MYFNIIQSFRGLSCLLIVIFHLNSKLLPNGYLGVDQFFIISGFLITFSILHNNNKYFSAGSFLLKRGKRILPLKCVVLYYVFILNKNQHESDLINLEENSIAAFLFYFNFKLINDNNDYFSSFNTNLILNFWSLSVEEQYYFFISALSYLLIYIHDNISIIIQIFIILLSFLLFHIKYYEYYIFSFYSIYTRLWEFGCGSLIYYYNIKSIDNFIMNISVFVQLLLMFSNVKHYLCFVAINLITFFQITYSKINDNCIISNRIINFIGKISYSVYLIHYSNILTFSRSNAIIYTIIFSVILHYLVETPFRNSTHDYILVILYSFSAMIYYKIYYRNYKISIQRNINKYFIKDMCSYDILDSLIFSKYSILLLGDSHVLHFLRAFYDNNQQVILYHSYMYNGKMYNENYNEIIYLLKYKFDLIIISFWQQFNRNSTYESEIYKLINIIKNITKNILVISENPLFNINPNECLDSSRYCYGIVNVNCSIIKPYKMSQFKYSKYLSVYDYNTNKYTINGNKCLFEVNGISIYRDFTHFNGFFVEKYLINDIHYILNLIFSRKIWKSLSVNNIKYHCLEENHNIYSGVCKKNKYKIIKIKSKDVKYI